MTVKQYLEHACKASASDLFFVAGAPATEKIGGELFPLDTDRLTAPDTERLIRELYAEADRDVQKLLSQGDDDFSFAIPSLARFRVSAYRQRGSLAAVIRIVAFNIPCYKDLGIPEEVMALADASSGLILFTGTAGSGKSTTQACIIDRINHTRKCHVITLEDPIEYLHKNDKSIISQREIATDTEDCLSALRASLRQAPDVILLGEMRDPQTVRTAITAAETGHTVIATLHTKGTANSIDRIIDTFPAEQQGQIRIQLAAVLHTAVSQQLVRSESGALLPVFELMHASPAVKSLIRDGKTHQLNATVAAASSEGMFTMDSSILSLYEKGLIGKDTALAYADDPEQLKRRIENKA